MGSHSRSKGRRREQQAAILTGGKRTWEHLHDLYAHRRWWEVKGEKTGYTRVYDALEEHAEHYEETGDGPVPSALIKQDRKPWIVSFFYLDWRAGRANPEGEPPR